jgi:hypothetical protein
VNLIICLNRGQFREKAGNLWDLPSWRDLCLTTAATRGVDGRLIPLKFVHPARVDGVASLAAKAYG